METTCCIYFLAYWSQSVPTIMILLDPQLSYEVGNSTIPILQMGKCGTRSLTSEKVHSPLLIPKSFLLWNLTFTNTLSERSLPPPFLYPLRSLILQSPACAPLPGSLPQVYPQSMLASSFLGLLLLFPWVPTVTA